ncbi:hypothetical protein [Nocardiopsis halotolerans]|uniref:hypothetical protein n=1 Tax=Nocardiopsis halotolerans TaxID=124252 RepID=UPI00034CB398|nr:hypothetical protein [Nocardiopsis halotolerans]
MAASPRTYVAFPDCEEAFPVEMFENALERDDIELSGEFSESEDDGYGNLQCSVETSDTGPSVTIFASAMEPEGEDMQERIDDLTENLEDMEAELPAGEVGTLTLDDQTLDRAAWNRSSRGDVGFTMGALQEAYGGEVAFASSGFVMDNLGVSVHYGTGSDGEAASAELLDVLALVDGLTGEVEDQLARVGETE